MAIDTENKRRSTLGLWGGPRILPRPDGAFDAPDSRHLWIYRGLVPIFAAPPSLKPLRGRRPYRPALVPELEAQAEARATTMAIATGIVAPIEQILSALTSIAEGQATTGATAEGQLLRRLRRYQRWQANLTATAQGSLLFSMVDAVQLRAIDPLVEAEARAVQTSVLAIDEKHRAEAELKVAGAEVDRLVMLLEIKEAELLAALQKQRIDQQNRLLLGVH